ILKERPFGLTGNEGNRGEDVKDYYFYVDATPSHSWLRYLYKYPQAAYPYERLVAENRRRGRGDAPLTLRDTGVVEEDRYWDVEVSHAKASPTKIHIRIEAHNRGPEPATLHLLPSLWFRNTWSWDDGTQKPSLQAIHAPSGAAWAVRVEHPRFGAYHLYGRDPSELLFTENETNSERLWGVSNICPHVKDAFHRRVVAGDLEAVNPDRHGTKFAAWHLCEVTPGQSARIELVLAGEPLCAPFARNELVFSKRQSEADLFFDELLPNPSADDRRVLRQALAGMIWCKQFFNYDVEGWLKGDKVPPPEARLRGRNRYWKHLKASDVISMPDSWEYPWFAAWDLAFHCGALALVDIDFAKDQVEILLREGYLHPNGQIPAYEWSFGDVNPPVHAAAALKVFRAERVQRGAGDFHFLHRVFQKLLLNYAWWINRKDGDGHNIFEGGFLGLDNISVFDRSQPLPPGFSLKQADATGWMAMFALNMTVMALELATEDPDYESIAIQTFTQFLAIANAIAGHVDGGVSLWDPEAGFFKDLIIPRRQAAPHRRLFAGRPDPALRHGGDRPAAACGGAAVPHAVAQSSRRQIPGQLCLRLSRLGEQARRASAGACRSHDAAIHSQAAVERARIYVPLRRTQRQPDPCRAARSRRPAGGRARPYRICAGRIDLEPVWRQFQLARADLDADQLFAGPGDRKVRPLSRRRL